eukprot:scaffold7119_cov119-Skeletonema_marinoi.AAC.2
MTPTSTSQRRQLFLASCTIAFTLLTSSFVLPAAFQKLTDYYASDNSRNNNATSLERWIDLQRPSARRDEDDYDVDNIITVDFSGADNDNNDNGLIPAASILSATDLTHLAYDSSCLSEEGHHVIGARYLEERRSAAAAATMMSVDQMGNNHESHRRLEFGSDELLTDDSSQDGPSLFIDNANLQYLRGGTMSDTYGSDVDSKRQDGSEDDSRAATRIEKTKLMSPKKMLLRTASSATTSLDDNHHNQNHRRDYDQLQSNHNDNLDKASVNQRNLINDYDVSTEQEEEGWSTHTGAAEIIAPPPSNTDAQLLQQHIMDYVDAQLGGVEEDISMNNAGGAGGGDDGSSTITNEEDEEEDDDEELYERLQQVMKVTQSLHRQFGGTPPPLTTSTTNNNATNTNTMTQYSHTSQHSRQRLLTGSYATWQWYDRSNLASPLNLKLNKVSRVNYAFFQSDTDGYIFGTDSWADPNVLNGPYDFSVSRDKLPSYCQGGRGRDDGKNIPNGGGLLGKIRRTRQRRRTQLSFGNVNDDQPQCEHFERCHRNFPNSKVCNTHKYKEGLIYLAHASGAEIYPSIGGWTLSGSFPTVAADVDKRRRFARECVGLIEDYGFDGIDIGEFFVVVFVSILWFVCLLTSDTIHYTSSIHNQHQTGSTQGTDLTVDLKGIERTSTDCC